MAHGADRIDLPGPGRCFPFWQEVLTCYVVNTTGDDDSGKKKCSPVLEDYYECLHHKKEVRNPAAAHPSRTRRERANMFALGRENTGTAGCVPNGGCYEGTRERTDRRPNTEPGTAGQGGGFQEGLGELMRRRIAGRNE